MPPHVHFFVDKPDLRVSNAIGTRESFVFACTRGYAGRSVVSSEFRPYFSIFAERSGFHYDDFD